MRPAGHTRCPRYVRGAVGVIARVHGDDWLPDAVARDEETAPEAVYAVRFGSRDLFGAGEEPRSTSSSTSRSPTSRAPDPSDAPAAKEEEQWNATPPLVFRIFPAKRSRHGGHSLKVVTANPASCNATSTPRACGGAARLGHPATPARAAPTQVTVVDEPIVRASSALARPSCEVTTGWTTVKTMRAPGSRAPAHAARTARSRRRSAAPCARRPGRTYPRVP